MRPFGTLRSRVIPLPRDDVDTDQIIPARFLKVTDKHGLGDSLGRTYLDRVRHIVIAAAKTQRNDGPSPWAFAVHGRSLDDQSPRLPRCRYRYVTMVTD